MNLKEPKTEYLYNTLSTIREINRLINYEKNISFLLDGICQLLTESKGFLGGWVILLDDNTPRGPYYHKGFGSSFSRMTDFLDKGSIPNCARTVMEDPDRPPAVITECGDCPFRGDDFYCSNITKALASNGDILGWMSVILPDELLHSDEEYLFLSDLADDIAHAIKTIHMETKLKESEERFQMLFQKAPLGYQALDEKGCFLEVNQAWLTTLGYDREEVLGHWFGEFLAPEYVDAFRERFPIFKKQGSIHSEFFMIHKKGERRYIVFEGRIGHGEKGEFLQTHCILSDQTEKKHYEDALKESEAHLRSIFDNISAGVFVYERQEKKGDFLLMDVNLAGIGLANRPKEEMIGRTIGNIFPSADKMGLLKKMEEACASGTARFLPMTEYQDDNLSLILESHITPLPSGRLVVLHEDKTDVFRMEERLRQSEKMEAIGKLAGGVAHDFNNILCGIMGYTELTLASTEISRANRENLELILQAGDRAGKLVDQILSFSRQQSGEKKPLNLVPHIEDAVDFLRATLPPTVKFDCRLDKETPPVPADPVKIHEIIHNLCTNGAFAMENRGTITIGYEKVYLEEEKESLADRIPPGSYALLTVSDEGCGMTPATLNRIFEPFYTTKDVGKGTGMGLSVVFGIVQNHQGHIVVGSEIDRGTRFEIYLPLTQTL